MDRERNKTIARRSALRLLGSAVGVAGFAVATESAAFAAPRDGRISAAADEGVRKAQEWVNGRYGSVPNFVKAPEDGITGWDTMYALTRALQIELGLVGKQLSNNFGDATLSLLTSKFGNIGPGTAANVVKIVQSGLYCKGYDGAGIGGTYGPATKAAVLAMRTHMGFTDPRNTLTPKEFKALLTMDAYVLVGGGSPAGRAAQQWMNRNYVAEPWFWIMPADGHGSRDVAKALVLAVQVELGVPAPNGNVGPATRAALKARPALTIGAADTPSSSFVRLFQAGMIFNRYEVEFDGVFSEADSEQVTKFQSFAALPTSGLGDFQTFCSLLVATGDIERPGIVADSSTPITAARAATLAAAGYQVAARYLTGKYKMQSGEIATILAAGLRVVPLFETGGDDKSYFTEDQGTADANQAVEAATKFGFKSETIIYYAVDYDAMNSDITGDITTGVGIFFYFRALKTRIEELGNPYRIGVYGPRNVCSRLSAADITVASMVGDIAYGYSGNLGFPLPADWAFDQFATLNVSSGEGFIKIDKSVSSGRDPGQSEVLPPISDRPA